jgi:hypothetical protein
VKRSLLALACWLLAPSAFAILDTNNNGVSDLWEREFNNGSLFGEWFDSQADPDADGWTNAQEAAAGSNPFDPNPPDGLVWPETAHTPAVYGEPDENGIPVIATPETVSVTWPTLVGKQYTLLFSPDLSAESWFSVGDAYIGNGNDFVYIFPTNGCDNRFWRVAITDVDNDGDGLTNHEEFLLGSNPLASDTSGDGVSDLWLAFHGFDPTVHHGAILFPGSVHSVVSAFRMGVQLRGGATPGDIDGDGVANHQDADTSNSTVWWRRGASPAWMLRFPDVEADARFVSLSTAGTVMFVSSDWTEYSVFTPGMIKRSVPRDRPAEGSGFFGPFGLPLHGDRVFGRNLTASSPPEEGWAYFQPADGSVSNAVVPVNNPPETIFDATNLHVSGVGGGFGMRTDGITPLFSGAPGLFESTENALSHGNGLRYWTYANGAYDGGRLVSASASLPGFGAAVSPSATVALPDGQASTAVHHLVPTSDGLYVAEGAGSFVATTWPAPLQAELGATRQGWVVDPSGSGQRLWVNGRWHPIGEFLPPRASDGAPLEMLTVHQVRDTGLIAAGIRYPGDEWKHALLTPIHLRIHHPVQDTTVPWNDYLPGYHLDEPVLCKATDPNHPRSFENLAFDSPQEIVLQFSGPAIEQADSIELEIQQVSTHPGWAGNAGDSQEEDFSFSPDSDSRNASAQVQGGSATITIHCKDYAAWAELRLILKKSGSPLHPDPIILTLPYDSNGDCIADCWQREQVKDWNRQFRMEPGDLDWMDPDDPQTWPAIFGADGTTDAELADSDGPTGPMPAMTDLGDGLTALDEYRGFFLDGGPEPGAPRHRRLSSARKDLLVECSEMEGIGNTGGSLLMPGFTDPGNDANGFAQAYSLGTVMEKVVAFYASEGPPIQSGADYFPGAAIDMWWVRDTLDDDAANIVYENGSVRSAYKYSGSFYDTQITGQRQAWLSIYYDNELWLQNQLGHDQMYGANASGVGIMANLANRNTHCRHFTKLALQGRKGQRNAFGEFVAVANQAAREVDEALNPSAPHQGSAIFVNSLSEERKNGQSWASHEVFMSKLFNSVAHEVAHLFVIGRNRDVATGGLLPILPFDGGEHIAGSGNLLGGASTVNGIRFHEEEIRKIHLRARASINRTPSGVIQP